MFSFTHRSVCIAGRKPLSVWRASDRLVTLGGGRGRGRGEGHQGRSMMISLSPVKTPVSNICLSAITFDIKSKKL